MSQAAALRSHDHADTPDNGHTLDSALSFIKLLHRHPDALINILSKTTDGRMAPRGGVLVEELDTKFAPIWKSATKDLYLSINASYATKGGGGKSRLSGHHRSANLRYLCACYADIDFHNGESNAYTVRMQVLKLYADRLLPHATLEIESGRGLWLIWLLNSPGEPNLAHKGAWDDNEGNHLRLYAKIQKAIHHRLARIGADPNALDAARHVRPPGSFNTDADSVVRWSLSGGPGSRPYSYALQELAAFLQIKKRERRSPTEQPVVRNGNKRRGYDQANANRLAIFKQLMELRGGFRAGCRNTAASIFADILRTSGVRRDEAMRLVEEMGGRCRPALLPSECASAARNAYNSKRRTYTYETLANKFDVTPEEANTLSSLTIKVFPPAAKFGGAVVRLNRGVLTE
jgi:hypothetical protein